MGWGAPHPAHRRGASRGESLEVPAVGGAPIVTMSILAGYTNGAAGVAPATDTRPSRRLLTLVVLDGVFVRNERGAVIFHPSAPPTREELDEIVRRVQCRALTWLRRQHYLDDGP